MNGNFCVSNSCCVPGTPDAKANSTKRESVRPLLGISRSTSYVMQALRVGDESSFPTAVRSTRNMEFLSLEGYCCASTFRTSNALVSLDSTTHATSCGSVCPGSHVAS